MKENTTLWIVITIIALHFVIGVGLLIYKILGAKSPEKTEQQEESPPS